MAAMPDEKDSPFSVRSQAAIRSSKIWRFGLFSRL